MRIKRRAGRPVLPVMDELATALVACAEVTLFLWEQNVKISKTFEFDKRPARLREALGKLKEELDFDGATETGSPAPAPGDDEPPASA